jgi:mRNA-degrading endonuclease RelE of RelBE toxin-antitoxin system
MKYQIKSLGFFQKQVAKLDKKSRRVIYDKIQLLKGNPYRYKRIRSKQYSKVFRVRFSINGREARLIYVVIEPNIILVCLLDRKKDYKNLEKYLNKIRKELKL